jgi:hypothetical protein
MKKTLLALLACATCFCAFAHEEDEGDDVPLYEGVWTVRFEGHRSARFALRDWAGTWQETGKGDPAVAACGRRKVPVTVQHSTPAHFEFTVWGSKAGAGCPDTSFVFQPVKDGVLEGASPAATGVVMKRVSRK